MNDIAIYWWNLGKKTLDFEGSYDEYLKKRDITKRRITHPYAKHMKGYRFKIPLSSVTATIDTFDFNYSRNCDEAIRVFLTLMGDKAIFHNGYGRTFKINWR